MTRSRFAVLFLLLVYSGAAISLSITRDNQVALDDAKSDSILAVGATLLKEKDAVHDIACDVPTFRRSEPVGVIDLGDATIDSEVEFDAVNAHDSYIKVVSTINWCGRIRVNIFGCARVGAPGFIVTASHPMFDRYPALQGLIWAHEYGHTKGLSHRDQFSAIMHPEASVDRNSVTTQECESFND